MRFNHGRREEKNHSFKPNRNSIAIKMKSQTIMNLFITLAICALFGFFVSKFVLVPTWKSSNEFSRYTPDDDGDVSVELRKCIMIGGLAIHVNRVRVACIVAALSYTIFSTSLVFLCIKNQ